MKAAITIIVILITAVLLVLVLRKKPVKADTTKVTADSTKKQKLK